MKNSKKNIYSDIYNQNFVFEAIRRAAARAHAPAPPIGDRRRM